MPWPCNYTCLLSQQSHLTGRQVASWAETPAHLKSEAAEQRKLALISKCFFMSKRSPIKMSGVYQRSTLCCIFVRCAALYVLILLAGILVRLKEEGSLIRLSQVVIFQTFVCLQSQHTV